MKFSFVNKKFKQKLYSFKDYFVYGFGQVINLTAPLLVAPRIIQICGINNWGQLSIAISVFTVLSILIDFGSNIVGVKEISLKRDNAKDTQEYLKKTYNLRVLLLLFLLLILIPTTYLLRLNFYVYLLGGFFLIGQTINPIWYFQGIQDFQSINKIIFLSKTIYILLVFVCITKVDDYKYLLFILGLTNTMVYIYFYKKIELFRTIKIFTLNKKNILETIKNEYSVVVSNLSISIYINAPLIIIGIVSNSYYAGVYKIGEMILTIYRSYLSVFFNVSYPKFCEKNNKNIQIGKAFLLKSNVINIFILLTSIIFINCIYYFLIEKISFNTDIKTALKFALLFLPISVIVAINIPFYQSLLFDNKIKKISYITLTNALIMVFLCYFLTKNYNIRGSVFSVYICETFTTSSIVLYYYLNFKKNERLVLK